MFDPTCPEKIQFTPVSPALVRVRVLSLIISAVVELSVIALIAYFTIPYVWILAGVVLLVNLWLIWLVSRQVRAIGYHEGDTEFFIRKGIMFKKLTVIPYGRIQFVDVNEGPIARHYGITSIELHTASVETAGTLDGLPAAEAARLRDMLASRGASEQAGL